MIMISRRCTFWDNLDVDPSNRTLNMNILNHIKRLTFFWVQVATTV